jgi:DNA-binding CsgD family transcriptional regulator
MRRRWTEDEIATLRRMTVGGYTDAAIADHLERTENQVKHKRRSLGLRPGVSREHAAALARVNMRRMNKRAA